MLEFTRVSLPYITHIHIETRPFHKGYPKVVTYDDNPGRSLESRSSGIRKFRAPISRLAPIWHSFPTIATYFASPKSAVHCTYVCICVFCVCQLTLRYKFRSLALRGANLRPNPNPRNPRCCNFYSATREIFVASSKQDPEVSASCEFLISSPYLFASCRFPPEFSRNLESRDS